jgi:hypothetical protein
MAPLASARALPPVGQRRVSRLASSFADLPVAAQFALMIAAGLGIAVLLSWIARRPRRVRIVTAWQSFDDVSTRVSGEAAALAARYYSASTLGEPARTDIQQHVLDYGRAVLCDELPRRRDGGRSSLHARNALVQSSPRSRPPTPTTRTRRSTM